MRFTKIVPLVLLFGVLCLVTMAVVRRSTTAKNSELLTTELAPAAAVAQSTGERGPVLMIRFVLWREGIYPRSMRVDHGILNVALEDKTGESAGLVIESVLGDQRTRITQINRVENHWRARTLVRLAPGNYLVSDASQPGNTAKLIVNP